MKKLLLTLLVAAVALVGAADASADWRGAPLEARSVSNGGIASCALDSEGKPWCWGRNIHGVVGKKGLGTTSVMPPTRIVGLYGARELSTDGVVACVVTRSREVACWGSNGWGQIGNGSTAGVFRLTAVPGLSDIREVSVGGGGVCALESGGQVICWGSRDYLSLTPAPVSGLTNAKDIDFGSHACAVRRSGQAVCWLSGNENGEIGDGHINDPWDPWDWRSYEFPTNVRDMSSAGHVSAGYSSSCAIRKDGQAFCWGNNESGQLGDGSRLTSPVPTSVTGIVDATEVEAGGNHACAIVGSGLVKCWGSNKSGQLGNGTTKPALRPVLVKGLSGVTSLSINYASTCATNRDGVWCWGNGLINGNSNEVLSPKRVRYARAPQVGRLEVDPQRNSVVVGGRRIYSVSVTNVGDTNLWHFRVCLKLPQGVIGSRCRPVYDLDPGEKRTRRFRILFTRKLQPGMELTLGFRAVGSRMRSKVTRAHVTIVRKH